MHLQIGITSHHMYKPPITVSQHCVTSFQTDIQVCVFLQLLAKKSTTRAQSKVLVGLEHFYNMDGEPNKSVVKYLSVGGKVQMKSRAVTENKYIDKE